LKELEDHTNPVIKMLRDKKPKKFNIKAESLFSLIEDIRDNKLNSDKEDSDR